MYNKTKISSRGRRQMLASLFAIFAAFALMQTGMISAFDASAALEGKLSPDAMKKVKIAGMQHALIMLLIEKRDFEGIEPEWKKVLDLKLGAEFEGPIAKSLVMISYSLLDEKRCALAQKLLDESLSVVPFSDKSKADIFACKAALYKESGDLDSAINAMRIARKLEEKP
jgi:hypothetical protein